MNTPLQELCAQRGLTIGRIQLQHLASLLDAAEVAAWEPGRNVQNYGFVVVDEVPNAIEVETLCRTLSPEATIIIPRSENPRFDFLKSRLRCHGTIGAVAPEAPHQIWWGGLAPVKAAERSDIIRQCHVVTSVGDSAEEELQASLFAEGLDNLGLSHTINISANGRVHQVGPELRSHLLLTAWEATEKPLIWIDPSDGPDLTAIGMNLHNADFAAIPTMGGVFATNFLYFGRSDSARDLLQSWHNLCCNFPGLPADHLLDAAWALVMAQRNLVTHWLVPRGNSVSESVHVGPLDLAIPARSQARKACRTGGPEPSCVLRGAPSGRCSLAVLMISSDARAADIAATTQSVLEAFRAHHSGFTLIGIMLCQSTNEAARTLDVLTDTWILYVRPGTILDHETFQSLDRRSNIDQPLFLSPRVFDTRRTDTGIELRATTAAMIFGAPAHFKAPTKPTSKLNVMS